ncbi:hypothetical protein PsorP6_012429 [Peronosclerospora sorghi]|uniref:Uncharacterized protein n=1 Tax=Peronosclerospora sorghi TaxID=230839 RepID=A0ACC0WGT4_9STRA|nr:hypothetical protein PsorP6_012429 [Peronosclerospora sorghi]
MGERWRNVISPALETDWPQQRKASKAVKDKLDTLDDANTDLMMGEGDNVQLFIGESFVKASEEMAREYVEKRVEEANMEMNKLQDEESNI